MDTFLYGILALALYFHFRWALLDTHFFDRTPGIVWIAVRSLITATGIFVAAGLSLSGYQTSSGLLWMSAIGYAFAPSLTLQLHQDPGQGAVSRFLDKSMANILWSALKTTVVWLISLPISLIPVCEITEHAAHWTMLFLALLFAFMKFCFVICVIEKPEKTQLGYPPDMCASQMWRLAGLGCLGLLTWTLIAGAFLSGIPDVNVLDVFGHIALAIGIYVSDCTP